jgi:hypothetical protein
MPEKPRVGLILLRAEWFDRVVALPGLAEGMQADAAQIVRELSKDLSVDSTWVVSSSDGLERAIAGIPTAAVDLFILAFQVWAEDFYLGPLVHAVNGRPLAVWCYLPWQEPPRPLPFGGVLRGSGPVGTLEGLGTLRNLGVNFLFTWGAPDSTRTRGDLAAFARAGHAWHILRRARVGVLPGRNEQMQTTFVDEFRLRHDLGPEVIPLSVSELKGAAEGLAEADVGAFARELRENYKVESVNEETLTWAARCSLGLAHLAKTHRLDLLSINDTADELHSRLGLRPCLYGEMMREGRVRIGLEGDLGAATAMLAQSAFTDDPLMFVEFWYWDEPLNTLVGGHAGLQDPRAAIPGKAWIGQDYEYAQTDRYAGAHFHFVARPGEVTFMQLRCTPDGWQAGMVSGEALKSEPWLEGYPHAVIRLAQPLDQFLRGVARVGSTQHWIMAYANTAPHIRALCSLLRIPLEDFTA